MNVLECDPVNANAEIERASPAPELRGRGLFRLAPAAGQKVEQRPAADDLANGRFRQRLESRLGPVDAKGEPAERVRVGGIDGVLHRGRDLEELAVTGQKQGIAVFPRRQDPGSAHGSPPSEAARALWTGPLEAHVEAAHAARLDPDHALERRRESEVQSRLEDACGSRQTAGPDRPRPAGSP